jgi:hypothetical protein
VCQEKDDKKYLISLSFSACQLPAQTHVTGLDHTYYSPPTFDWEESSVTKYQHYPVMSSSNGLLRYDDEILTDCATVVSNKGTFADAIAHSSCVKLRQAHVAHYHCRGHHDGASSCWTNNNRLKSQERWECFLHSVQHVHQHNNGEETHLYRVTLNQFSDMLPHELPFSSNANGEVPLLGDQLLGSGLFEKVPAMRYLHLQKDDAGKSERQDKKNADFVEFMHVLRPVTGSTADGKDNVSDASTTANKIETHDSHARSRLLDEYVDEAEKVDLLEHHKRHHKDKDKQPDSVTLHKTPKHVRIDYPSSDMSDSGDNTNRQSEVHVNMPGGGGASDGPMGIALNDPFLNALVLQNEDTHISDGQEVRLEKNTSPDDGISDYPDHGTKTATVSDVVSSGVDNGDQDSIGTTASSSNNTPAVTGLATKMYLKIAKDMEHAQNWFTTVKASSELFDKQIDWSLAYLGSDGIDNPDGVSVVHTPMDQGPCGSCWAIAATGTLEASIVRREGLNAFAASVRDSLVDMARTLNYKNMSDIKAEATIAAMGAEEFALEKANLSVQELVDCDLPVVGMGGAEDGSAQPIGDQGCNGGNPILAFFFIHKYGLTSSDFYPYVYKSNYTKTKTNVLPSVPTSPSFLLNAGVGLRHRKVPSKVRRAPPQMTCNYEAMAQPIASVQSWGILTPDYEDNMELVLRYIGPVAVGIYGAHPSFLGYAGGVFDLEDCPQYPNHALLVVGYGEEDLSRSLLVGEGDGDGNDDDGSVNQDGSGVVRYWIARNSWGEGWGENGYVRIRRNDGQRGRKSICGISQNPSVALGGYFVEPENISQLAGFQMNKADSTSPHPGPLGQNLNNNDHRNGPHSFHSGPSGTLRWDCARLGFGNDSVCVHVGG